MNEQEIYDMVLADLVSGDIYEPKTISKYLNVLLEPEEAEKFAEMLSVNFGLEIE